MASPNKTSGLAVVSVCRATICSSWVKRCPPPSSSWGAACPRGWCPAQSEHWSWKLLLSPKSHKTETLQHRVSPRGDTEPGLGAEAAPPEQVGGTPLEQVGEGLPRSRQGGVGCGRPVQRFRAERNLGENKKSAPRVPGACTRIPRILRLGPRDSPSGSVPGGWGEQEIRLERAGRVPLRPRTQRSARKCVSHSSSRTRLPSAETGVRCRHGREHRTHGEGGNAGRAASGRSRSAGQMRLPGSGPP